MATTDLHMQIFPFNYDRDCDDFSGSFLQICDLVDMARGDVQNSLLFDVGDFLQGNPMGDLAFQEQWPLHGPHPMIKAMNGLGYDGATTGNHDYNFGVEFLERCLLDADFPIVCSNIVRATDRETLFPASRILERTILDNTGAQRSIRIGLIGLAPPQIIQWDKAVLDGKLIGLDIVRTAQKAVSNLQKQGVDIIIGLAHTGIGADAAEPMMENAAIPTAEIDGLDVLLIGHSHQVFPDHKDHPNANVDAKRGFIHGKPAVCAGTRGNGLGVIDLRISSDKGKWRVSDANCTVMPVDKEPSRSQRENIVEQAVTAHKKTRAFTGRPVGTSPIGLNSYFAQLGVSTAVSVVAHAQMSWVRNQIKETRFSDLPMITASAPFKSGGLAGAANYTDIPAGAISLRNVFDLDPYPNYVAAHVVSGALIRDWIDHAAGQFRQMVAGQKDQQLLNFDFPGYHFDLLYGVEYEIDLTQPARFDAQGNIVDRRHSRVTACAINGRELADDTHCLLISNNYRLSGGGGYPEISSPCILDNKKKPVRETVSEFIAANGISEVPFIPAFRFKPISETKAVFQTGQGALDTAAGIEGLDLENHGSTTQGFREFYLRF